MLAREAGTQDWLSEQTGIPKVTLQRILAGKADPRERLSRLVEVIGTTEEHILEGPTAATSSIVEVPIYPIDVAAGPGRLPFDEVEPIGSWPFPRDWLFRQFGDDAVLRIVRVVGDSQVPELFDGDMVMIDLKANRLREGMHVVRLGETLMIKRIQLEGATVRLKSANQSYSDVVVNLAAEQDEFAVIGKAGWAGKLL